MVNASHVLTTEQKSTLRALIRDRGEDRRMADRARMVLWWDAGRSAGEIAELLGVSRPTVYVWPARFAEGGVEGLRDTPRPGVAPVHDGAVRARILAVTRQSPPTETGLSHWSSRELAGHLKRAEGIDVSHNFIADLWRRHDLQPHRQGTFKLSGDPDFEAKVADVVGLYLDPPQGAVVLSFDEKTQVQALDRTQPLLPIDFGRTEQRTHDYVRHGTTNLFAALNTATGEVLGRCFPRRRTEEFLAFMDGVAAGHAGKELHIILDNLSTHAGPDVERWLSKHPRITFHFTPTGSSWLNQVETWFGIITKQAIRRGTFVSVRHLITTIHDYISHWNQDAEPFAWTATPGEIIMKVRILHRDFKKLLANNWK